MDKNILKNIIREELQDVLKEIRGASEKNLDKLLKEYGELSSLIKEKERQFQEEMFDILTAQQETKALIESQMKELDIKTRAIDKVVAKFALASKKQRRVVEYKKVWDKAIEVFAEMDEKYFQLLKELEEQYAKYSINKDKFTLTHKEGAEHLKEGILGKFGAFIQNAFRNIMGKLNSVLSKARELNNLVDQLESI